MAAGDLEGRQPAARTASLVDVTRLAQAVRHGGLARAGRCFGAVLGDFRALVSQWPGPSVPVLGGRETVNAVWEEAAGELAGFAAHMQFTDTLTYLPDDILTKVDRASMAVSLEVRVPLLDHRAVEFAWSLPQDFKIRGREGKWILRRVLDRHVPRVLMFNAWLERESA